MIDRLGHPFRKGDIVLTSGYGSTNLNIVAKVERVNKKPITINLIAHKYEYNGKNYERKEFPKKMRRTAEQAVVINEQLAYNEEHYPENLI